MSNYKHHAMQEFKAAGWLNEDGTFKDGMQEDICNHVLKLLDVFDDEGHSGSSANYAIGLFTKLADFKPIAPLTGEDWEWTYVCDDRTDGVAVYQNKRCSTVFKQSDRFDGQPYDINAVVFYDVHERELYEEEEGYPGVTTYKSYYTSSDSFRPITFPYTPVVVYEERDSE